MPILKPLEDSLSHEEPADDLCEFGPLVVGGLSQVPGLCPPGKLTKGELELDFISSFSIIFFMLPVIDDDDLVLAGLLVHVVLVLELDLELELSFEYNCVLLQTRLSVFCVSMLEFDDDFDDNECVL